MWVRKKNGIFAMIYYWALKMEIEKRISGKVLGVTEFGCSELELLIASLQISVYWLSGSDVMLL